MSGLIHFDSDGNEQSMYQNAVPGVSGIININKPAGMTSHDVVARTRRLLHTRRVGHAGTLDPLATGVLPVCIGQATRIVEYLGELGKEYRATIHLGEATDTYDAEGAVTSTAPVPEHLTEQMIANALQQFTGDIQQVPPIYSAIKQDGQKLYELARQGITVEIAPRQIHIDAITIVAWNNPVLVIDVSCGAGTYIRSLAHDLGIALQTYGHLTGLIRTRSGSFHIRNSITLEQLAEAAESQTLDSVLYATDEGILHFHAMLVGPTTGKRIINGLAVECTQASEDQVLRVYTDSGEFMALLTYDHDHAAWMPHKVFLQERKPAM